MVGLVRGTYIIFVLALFLNCKLLPYLEISNLNSENLNTADLYHNKNLN